MKVKELIAELQKFDGELIVKIEDIFEGYNQDCEVSGVVFDKDEYPYIDKTIKWQEKPYIRIF